MVFHPKFIFEMKRCDPLFSVHHTAFVIYNHSVMTASKGTLAAVVFVMSNIAVVVCVSFFAIPVNGGVTIKADKGHKLTGQVINDEGQAIANARITILKGTSMTQTQTNFNDPGSIMAATSDQKGHFTIDGLALGTYTLKEAAHGYKTSKQKVLLTKGGKLTIKLKSSR